MSDRPENFSQWFLGFFGCREKLILLYCENICFTFPAVFVTFSAFLVREEPIMLYCGNVCFAFLGIYYLQPCTLNSLTLSLCHAHIPFLCLSCINMHPSNILNPIEEFNRLKWLYIMYVMSPTSYLNVSKFTLCQFLPCNVLSPIHACMPCHSHIDM